MNENIPKAVAVIRDSPGLDDEGIYNVLVAEGIDPHLAGRLAIFLPMVYFRLLLADSGATFSDNYQSRLPDGTNTPSQPLTNEPVWNDAMVFAKAEIKKGLSGKDLLAIAGRCPEFEAANQILKKGAKLDDIGF